MLLFSVLMLSLALVLYQQAYSLFLTNPGLHAAIVALFASGAALLYTAVIRLFRDTRWLRRAIEGQSRPSDFPPEIFVPLSYLAQSGLASSPAALTAMESVLTITFDRFEQRLLAPTFLSRLIVGLGTIGLLWSIAGASRDMFLGLGEIQTALKENVDTTAAASSLGMRLATHVIQGTASVLFATCAVFALIVLSWFVRRANNQLYNGIENMLSFVTMVPKKAADG
jgi:hypothetical protein